jgi:hypothetical protein
VHYSTVTKGYLETYFEKKEKWQRHFGEDDKSERVTDELNQAVMIHAKSLNADMTSGYKHRCRQDWRRKWQGCWVAFPFPPTTGNVSYTNATSTPDGYSYNCYINQRVENYWIPRLRKAMQLRKAMWDSNRGSPTELVD